MFNYYLDAIKNHYVDFNGRARRSEYWYFTLFTTIISLTLTYILGQISYIFAVISIIYSLAVFLPSLGVLVRRLHDVGKSGWFFFIALIPLIGIIWLLVLLCTDSVPGQNEYGPNPKGFGNNMNDDQLINSIGTQS